jgi:hypothetical protein
MKKNSFLLPGRFKLAGLFFFVVGVILGVIRFYFGIKPDLLDLKPFAFYSSYLESKQLQFIGNNMSEEVVCLLLLTGLFFISFSKEKHEDSVTTELRMRALYITAYSQFFFLIAAILFTYGMAFMYTIIIGMFIPFIVFIITLRLLLRGRKKMEHQHEPY